MEPRLEPLRVTFKQGRLDHLKDLNSLCVSQTLLAAVQQDSQVLSLSLPLSPLTYQILWVSGHEEVVEEHGHVSCMGGGRDRETRCEEPPWQDRGWYAAHWGREGEYI